MEIPRPAPDDADPSVRAAGTRLVRELVIAHARPGLHKVYDQHTYRDEKRECLELWAARLNGIVEPPPPNVVALQRPRELAEAAR